jgi:hypothetical protein
VGQIPRVNLEVLYGYINAWDAMQSSACAQEIEKEKKGGFKKEVVTWLQGFLLRTDVPISGRSN